MNCGHGRLKVGGSVQDTLGTSVGVQLARSDDDEDFLVVKPQHDGQSAGSPVRMKPSPSSLRGCAPPLVFPRSIQRLAGLPYSTGVIPACVGLSCIQAEGLNRQRFRGRRSQELVTTPLNSPGSEAVASLPGPTVEPQGAFARSEGTESCPVEKHTG